MRLDHGAPPPLGVLLFFLWCLSGCVSMGPADWRPEQHVMMMRSCQVMCSKAGGAKGYSIVEGDCQCRK